MNPETAFAEIKQIADKHREFLNNERPPDWNVLEEHELWFRGESQTYTFTTSTLSRALPEEHKDFESLRIYQMWIYTKLKKVLFEKHRHIFNDFSNSWNYPFFMQHYEIPTAFVDFTPSLETSLYFATKKADTLSKNASEEELPVLWLFDPTTFNHLRRNKNKWSEVDDNYDVGAGQNGDFYDFMVLGGEWRHDGTYHKVIKSAREIVGRPKFVYGISSALSPHSKDIYASKQIERMYKQRGYFFYSDQPFVDIKHIIYHCYNRAQVRYNQIRGTLDTRLLMKLRIPADKAKLIKTYLEDQGYDDAYFGLDAQIEGLNKDDFSYQCYLNETNGGMNGKNKDTFVQEYIAPLEVWLD